MYHNREMAPQVTFVISVFNQYFHRGDMRMFTGSTTRKAVKIIEYISFFIAPAARISQNSKLHFYS